MIASLPMYDWPELRAATDAWWTGIARHLRQHGFAGVPEVLDRDADRHDHWRSPKLLLSQTCGYPLTHAFEGLCAVAATPIYSVEGCEEANYSSVIVVRRGSGISKLEDLRGRTAAYNSTDSLSGHLALKCVLAPLSRDGRFLGAAVASGHHADSLAMVRDGKADVAAIDCVSYAIARRYRPALTKNVKIVARSPLAPALPYVTANGRPPAEFARLRRALLAAATDEKLAEVREALFLGGIEFLDRAAYGRVLELEAECNTRGYTELA